jgi:hypothetical protein
MYSTRFNVFSSPVFASCSRCFKLRIRWTDSQHFVSTGGKATVGVRFVRAAVRVLFVQICSLFWPQLAKYDKRLVNGVSRATRVLLLLMILVLMLCVCVLFVQS